MDGQMENLICLDSSVLINHYREKQKSNTFFYKLLKEYDGFVLSIVAQFEVFIGASKVADEKIWADFFLDVLILPYTPVINKIAIEASKRLRKSGQQLEFKDLIIGSTAMQVNLPLATLNEKHFDKLDNLAIITPFSLL